MDGLAAAPSTARTVGRLGAGAIAACILAALVVTAAGALSACTTAVVSPTSPSGPGLVQMLARLDAGTDG